MNRTVASLALLAALVLVVGLAGCNSKDSKSSSTAPTVPINPPVAQTKPGEPTDASPSQMEQMQAELAKLSPEDAASAEKQHVCPVSGEMLGTMGAPLKIDVNGQQVWICCDGCKEKLLANPDEYLAKLNKE